MKKLFVILCAAVMLVGCSAQEPAAEPAPASAPAETAAPAPEAAVEAEPEPEAAYTVPENSLGLTNATVGELDELIAGGGSFYLYVDRDRAAEGNYAVIDQGIQRLLKDFGFPMDFYYANESILTGEELEQLAAALGDPFDVEGSATYSGVYAFENGSLKNSASELVIGGPEATDSKVINFVFESDLFQNDHGMEIISYEQLKERIDHGARFMVYIGRDTCPYCAPLAKSLEKAIEARPLNVPIAYFYTQSYKTAINREEEGAQEAWDAVKADIGFEFTPSLLVFENGEQILAYEGGIGSEYFDMDDDAKLAERERAQLELEEWFMDCLLTDKLD